MTAIEKINQACTAAGPALFWFAFVFSVIAALAIAIVVYGCIWAIFRGEWDWRNYFETHLTQFMGIFFATGASMILIELFTVTTKGDVKITAPGGFTFEGITVPLVMWMLLFLAICFGIRMFRPKAEN